jgi:tRNA G10  N-methylase Trm11
MTYVVAKSTQSNRDRNRLSVEDTAAHEWYRFVLSFPPHLVREYLSRFGLQEGQRVLDPFCGTGTTLVECKKQGVSAVGIEANPMAHFASVVKCTWTADPTALILNAQEVHDAAEHTLRKDGIEDPPLSSPTMSHAAGLRSLPREACALLLRDSISPRPLHKALVLLDAIDKLGHAPLVAHMRLAFAKTAVFYASNLRFGPEVGLGKIKSDAAVLEPWFELVQGMSNDLVYLGHQASVPTEVHFGDAREAGDHVEPRSIDAVITSPPYPNEKDYTRATRLESVLLGILQTKDDLRRLKATLVRSNTRGVYKSDDDDRWVGEHEEIGRLADSIEERRKSLGKTSGFERLYARVTRLYFGGMARHLASLRPVLRSGARLAFVVGDQASYLKILIRTAHILADIAASLGYEVEDIDLFRTRAATATRTELREEVLLLSWPGGK